MTQTTESIINRSLDTEKEGVKIKGTVGELLTNMAPSLTALLQWIISNDFKTHNVIMELLQYLLAPVNDKVKKGIGLTYGKESAFFERTNTNLDSLLAQALIGYKKDLPFNISVEIFGIFLILVL